MPIDTAPFFRPLPDRDDALIPSAQLPLYIGISPQTLARWRHEGKGPEYLKLGGKLVAYRTGDLRSWLDTNRRSNTSAA